jgi:hypothetical protein
MNDAERKTYEIGGRRFYQEPLIAIQDKWIWPIIKDLMFRDMTGTELLDLAMERGTEIASIVLIEEGQTPADKKKAGLVGVMQLQDWLDSRVCEFSEVIADFFVSGQLQRLALRMAKVLPRPSQMTGLIVPSSFSAAETSNVPNGSGVTSG